MTDNTAFMEIVQLHERQWGMESYPNRPNLTQLLSSLIVAMWVNRPTPSAAIASGRAVVTKIPTMPSGHSERFMLTCHDSPDDLSQILFDIIMAGKVTVFSNRELAKVWVRQQEAIVSGLTLQLTRKE